MKFKWTKFKQIITSSFRIIGVAQLNTVSVYQISLKYAKQSHLVPFCLNMTFQQYLNIAYPSQ